MVTSGVRREGGRGAGQAERGPAAASACRGNPGEAATEEGRAGPDRTGRAIRVRAPSPAGRARTRSPGRKTRLWGVSRGPLSGEKAPRPCRLLSPSLPPQRGSRLPQGGPAVQVDLPITWFGGQRRQVSRGPVKSTGAGEAFVEGHRSDSKAGQGAGGQFCKGPRLGLRLLTHRRPLLQASERPMAPCICHTF